MPTAYRIIPKEALHAAIDAILPFPADITPAEYAWGYPPFDLLAHYHGAAVKVYQNADLEDLACEEHNVAFIYDQLFAGAPFTRGEVILFPVCGDENTHIDALAVAASDLRHFLVYEYEDLFGSLKLVYNMDADVNFIAPAEHRIAYYRHCGYFADVQGRRTPYHRAPLYPLRIGNKYVVAHPWMKQGDYNVLVWETAKSEEGVRKIFTTLLRVLGRGYAWGTSLPYMRKKGNRVLTRKELAQHEDYHPLLAQNVSLQDALQLQAALKDLPCEVEIVPAAR